MMSRFRSFTHKEANHSNTPKSDPPPASAGPQIALDEDGIPILNQVVIPEQIESDDEILEDPDESLLIDLDSEPTPTDNTASSFSLNLPKHEALLSAMRSRLHDQLAKDIAPLVPQIAQEIASEVAADFEKQFQERFSQALQQKIETLIDETVDQQLDES